MSELAGHYARSHGILWMPLLFGVSLCGALFAFLFTMNRTRTVRIGAILVWFSMMSSCVVSDHLAHERATRPEALFDWFFGFAATPDVRFVRTDHDDSFDAFGAQLELYAAPATIDRLVRNPRVRWTTGATRFHDRIFLKRLRDHSSLCAGASQSLASESFPGSFASGTASLCTFDSGRVIVTWARWE